MGVIGGGIQFPFDVFVARHLAGRSFPVKIADFAGAITLPREADFETEDGERSLTSSPCPADFIESLRDIDWGYEYGPDGPIVLRAVVLSFHVEGTPDKRVLQGEEIVRALPAWLSRLGNLLEVLTKQDLKRSVGAKVVWHQLKSKEGSEWVPASSKGPSLKVHFADESLRASEKQWTQALMGASGNLEPALWSLLLRDARHFLNEGFPRACIIDAFTAVEVALAFALNKAGASKRKVRAPLASKLRACREHGLQIPDVDLKGDLIRPRHDAVHQGIAIRRQEASRALQSAETIIKTVAPELTIG